MHPSKSPDPLKVFPSPSKVTAARAILMARVQYAQLTIILDESLLWRFFAGRKASSLASYWSLRCLLQIANANPHLN